MGEKSKRSFSIISSVPEALGFNDADLKANRAGVLSERQRRRMVNARGIIGVIAGIAGVIFAASVAGTLLLLVTHTGSQNTLSTLILIAVISAIVTGFAGFRFIRMPGDTMEAKIICASGVVRRKKVVRRTRHGEVVEFYIYTDALPFRFRVDDVVYDAFANRGLKGGYYSLYYLAQSKTLLSAEPLDNPTPGESFIETVAPEMESDIRSRKLR